MLEKGGNHLASGRSYREDEQCAPNQGLHWHVNFLESFKSFNTFSHTSPIITPFIPVFASSFVNGWKKWLFVFVFPHSLLRFRHRQYLGRTSTIDVWVALTVNWCLVWTIILKYLEGTKMIERNWFFDISLNHICCEYGIKFIT